MIEEAPRGADDYLRKGLQLRALLEDTRAASDHEDARAERRIQPGELTSELPGQLAGWGDEQGDGRGDRGLASLSVAAAVATVGARRRPRATVLPEPVWEEIRRSRPVNSGSKIACWMAVNCSNPALRRAAPRPAGACSRLSNSDMERAT